MNQAPSVNSENLYEGITITATVWGYYEQEQEGHAAGADSNVLRASCEEDVNSKDESL